MTLAQRGLVLVSAVVIVVVTARLLGSEGRGLYALVILATTVLRMIAGLGLDTSSTYHAANGRIPSDRLLTSGLLLCATVGLGLPAAAAAFHATVGLPFLRDVPAAMFAVAAAATPFALAGLLVAGIALGRGNVIAFNVISAAHPVVFALAIAFLLAVWHASLLTVFVVWTAITVLVALVSTGWFVRRLAPRPAFVSSDVRPMVSYGSKTFAANILQFLHYRVDLLLVSAFLDLRQVGLYSTAVAVAELLLHVPFAIGTVVLPRVSAAAAGRARVDSPAITRHVTLFVSVLAIALAVVAGVLFPLAFSREFSEAIAPFYILLPGVAALGISRVAVNDLAGRGRPEINVYVSAGALALNVALNLVLIPIAGIRGAATATSITYILASAALLAVFSGATGAGFRRMLIVDRRDLGAYAVFGRRLLGRMGDG